MKANGSGARISRRGCKFHSVPLRYDTSAGTAGGCFVAAALLATALPFFFATFLAADFAFRFRIAFFCIEVRFVGMGIFLSTSDMRHRPYNSWLRHVQGVRGGNGSLTPRRESTLL
jgi:hypothetical protein